MIPTTQGPPRRSVEQRRDALRKANATRSARSELKRDLKAGRAAIIDVLLDPPAFLENAKVFDVLIAAPKVGRVKASKLLRDANASPTKTMAGLSPRQRSELASVLGRRQSS